MRYSTNIDVRQYLPLCALPSLTRDGDPTAVSIDDARIDFAGTSATADIDSYLVNVYDLTVTHSLKPDFLRHCEAIFICVWICRHSSNGTIPPGLQAFYDEKTADLVAISQGARQIPGIAVRSDPGVSMSNLTHDQRYGVNKLRTAPLTNTGDQNSVVPRNTDYIPMVY